MSDENVTREQARVWLQTVIHPLRAAVAMAAGRAKTSNWSFRAHLEDTELLRASIEAVPPVYHLNLRHYLKHRPEIAERIRTYDQRLAALRVALQESYRWLAKQEGLREVAAKYPEKDVAGALAEYSVNALTELPHHYVLRELWASVREEVTRLWSSDDGRVHRQRMDDAGRAFSEVLEPLADALDAEVLDLAERYGVPPVEPKGMAS